MVISTTRKAGQTDNVAVNMTTPDLQSLLPLALDMTSTLTGENRRLRLIEIVAEALPCDCVALLRLSGPALIPVASVGLSAEFQGRRFPLELHPRLEAICASATPIRFPADSELPDPYDGLVMAEEQAMLSGTVHSCLGCPLIVEGEVVGVLTADALAPGAFDGLDDTFLIYLAALAAASLRTADLIEALESTATRHRLVASQLAGDALHRESGTIVGTSKEIRALRDEIDLVAASDFPVLVSGETGVGKELCVRRLHAYSSRRDEPLVYVNCAALPESIVESELFGHVRGAFTGADKDRLGKFSLADGASLFLDEIGELPLHVQPKLLRALQEGEVQRVGSDEVLHVNVRVIAATNRRLADEVAAGRFRSDLLHRLDVARITVPPLRERREDIPALAGYFADRTRARLGTGPIRFTGAVQSALMEAPWLGNARELENAVARATLRAAARTRRGDTVVLELSDLDGIDPSQPANPEADTGEGKPEAAPLPLRDAVDQLQRRLIAAAVEEHHGNWAAAARALDVERSNLHRLALRLGLK